MPREGKGAGLFLVLRDKQEETAPAGGQAACEGQKCEKSQQHAERPSVYALPTLGQKEDTVRARSPTGRVAREWRWLARQRPWQVGSAF